MNFRKYVHFFISSVSELDEKMGTTVHMIAFYLAVAACQTQTKSIFPKMSNCSFNVSLRLTTKNNIVSKLNFI